jgi:hypothetical protein
MRDGLFQRSLDKQNHIWTYYCSLLNLGLELFEALNDTSRPESEARGEAWRFRVRAGTGEVEDLVF